MTARILIVGGSFGGLATARELRRRLGGADAEITVISKSKDFTFIPSLPWVAMGSKTLERISFGLPHALARMKVNFAHAELLSVDTGAKKATTDKGDFPYDFLVVATGHRSANEAVPGLGPEGGPGHSLMSPPEALQLRDAVTALLHEPRPVVVGCAPGASCIGPAYEFAFELDYLLRRQKRRHSVPITFLTPEPHLGHVGIGGVGRLRQFLEGAFEERDIGYRVNAAISKITSDAVSWTTPGGAESSTPSGLSMVIPPLAGVSAIAGSEGLANPKGFVPVDAYYRHPKADSVYAVGVAVALPPAEDTPVPVNFPKTGHMSEQMAAIAAADIAATITGKERPAAAPLSAMCILDMGDQAAFMSASPIRPPRETIPKLSHGRRWLVAKRIFERAYLWYGRRGRRVPTALGW